MAIRTLVWFKRDLRESDHAPLVEASRASEALAFSLLEPQWLTSGEFDPRHRAFLLASLRELKVRLARRGLPLLLWQTDAIDALERIHQAWAFDVLVSHEETGSGWSWTRDKAVGAWCRRKGVVWREYAQTGVVRRLKDRRGWAARWEARMRADILQTPVVYQGFRAALPEAWIALETALLTSPAALDGPPRAAGEQSALQRLHDFVHEGAQGYRTGLSSPLLAPDHCSRLSEHLAFGTVSMRQVYQTTLHARTQSDSPGFNRDLASFASRLRWHCHFMQKLEDEPEIEFRNFMRACDGLREGDSKDGQIPLDRAAQDRLSAWQAGMTGFPMVDACMRMLNATGWINFRMRAMLVSFAAYHLWLHWRLPGQHLARQFLDFEPGIHWSQMQMQSGTTGINTLRIYSPSKQARDQDPQGVFMRQWLPEWGTAAYPEPIVDEGRALERARSVMYGMRREEAFRIEADRVQNQHGSRRSGLPPSGQRSGAGPGSRPPAKSKGRVARSPGIAQGEPSIESPLQGELF